MRPWHLAAAVALVALPSAPQARKKRGPPEQIAFFDAAQVEKAFQGTWQFGNNRLVVAGKTVTDIEKDGTKHAFTLLAVHPGRVSFATPDGGATHYAFAVQGDKVHLYTGRAGLKRGDLYVVADTLFGGGVTVFDAKAKTCTTTPFNFGRWDRSEKTECSLGKKDGHPVFNYALPDTFKKGPDGKPTLKRKFIYIVGDALLEEADGSTALKKLP